MPSRPNSQWIRPLEEEGIETHPGPRYIGRNVNGLASQDRFQQCMHSVINEHKRDGVAAVFIQEHNLKPSLAVFLRLQARRYHRVLWLARYAPASEHKGKGHGTAIAIPLDSIEQKPGESPDHAGRGQGPQIAQGFKMRQGDKDHNFSWRQAHPPRIRLRPVGRYEAA